MAPSQVASPLRSGALRDGSSCTPPSQTAGADCSAVVYWRGANAARNIRSAAHRGTASSGREQIIQAVGIILLGGVQCRMA
ncbi:MAG TPA: hypothetical protein VMW63_08890 [Methanoregulaceae archaeon]|nr:hypothetical protein [Methanoregulaceae archaeon]